MKHLQEPLEATRPVLLHNRDFPEYPYTLSGSAFVATWRGHHYIVTAKHVARGRPREDVLILASEDSPALLQLVSSAWPEGGTRDVFDLLVYRIARPPASLQAIGIACDVAVGSPTSFTSNEPLLVSGYPGEAKDIDYENADIRTGRSFFDAVYLGTPDPDEPFYHQLQWTDTGAISSIAGMSGGPVMRYGGDGWLELGGVLLQGGASSDPAHFVDTAFLRGVLDLELDRNRPA
jgi:hypothetical protein